MRSTWTLEWLTRRIDRCYLVAAWTKVEVKRAAYLRLARYYRAMLSNHCRARQATRVAAA